MSETSSYFNTHIDCFGYLNSIRDVPFGKGKNAGTFTACTIAALHGPKENPNYTSLQAKIAGRNAAHFIDQNRDAVKEKRKLLVKVRLSDPWIDQFPYPSDHKTKAGQPGASIKTRLLFIKPTTFSELPSFCSIDTNCFGYLNRIRDVPAETSETEEDPDTFIVCSIAALQGPKEKPDYCKFKARVTERDAEHLINRCRPAVDEERKVLVGVRLSDLWIHQFTYSSDHKTKAGQPGASIKTCLPLIKWINVDGKRVYSRPKNASQTETQEPSAPDQSVVADLPGGAPSDSPAPELTGEATELASQAA